MVCRNVSVVARLSDTRATSCRCRSRSNCASKEPVPCCLAREEVEKLQGVLIAPMEIFDHQQERLGGRGSQEDVRKLGEEAALLLFRVQGGQRREACEFGQMLDRLRKQGSEHACGGSQSRGNLGR